MSKYKTLSVLLLSITSACGHAKNPDLKVNELETTVLSQESLLLQGLSKKELKAQKKKFKNGYGVSGPKSYAKELRNRLVKGDFGSTGSIRFLVNHPLFHINQKYEAGQVALLLNQFSEDPDNLDLAKKLELHARRKNRPELLEQYLNQNMEQLKQDLKQKNRPRRLKRDLQGSLFIAPIKETKKNPIISANFRSETAKMSRHKRNNALISNPFQTTTA